MGLQLCKSQWAVNQKINMYKLAILCVAIVGAFAAPNAEADADAYYGYHYPALYNAYPNWPGVSGPGGSSTCFGCRGKRSAEAEADAEPGHLAGYYGYPYHGYPYGYGHYFAPSYGYGYNLPGHSYTHVQHALGKRSAEADAEPGHYGYYGHPYGYYGYPYHFGYRAIAPLPIVGKAGVGGHPGGATSFVATS